ncbi:hypothetical protein SLEP1_g23215 [Rubroshorea leprosula]|uniref:hAT-like transposase RNase-H fold domain-containing protein n=1 Tax=Rubroshorea leprosula TaxID=152421 RepID=A0AAV5JBM2_9ROSI|nr:hypothetical protein SLEP1_g23215 [Rubroshorea leprosula]
MEIDHLNGINAIGVSNEANVDVPMANSATKLHNNNGEANDGLVRVRKDVVNKWGTTILGGKDTYMRCATHIINLVVGEGTKEKEMNKFATAIRAVVNYVRQSPMRLKRFKEACEWAEIESKNLLCLDVQTRWNSLYLMLDTAKRFEEAFEKEMNMNIFFAMVLDPRYKIDYSEYLMLKMYGHKLDGKPDNDGPFYVAMVKREMGMLFEEYKRLNSSTVKLSDCQSFDKQGSSSTSTTNIQSVADSKNRVQTSQVRFDYKKFKAINGRRTKKPELEKYLVEDLGDENEDIDVL